MKSIDLTNKCGSCQNFKPVPGTLHGDCLENPYGDDVAHDPNHPYWQVGRSRIKCAKYRARTKPQANADRIRAMSDEELAEFLCSLNVCKLCNGDEEESIACHCHANCQRRITGWLRQAVKDGEDE